MVRRVRWLVCWMLAMTMALSPCGVYAQQKRASAPASATVDLGYVTPGAVLAAVAYPRRVLSAPEMGMLPIEVISAAAKKELGIEPLDVEQLMLIVEPPTAGPPGFGLVVRFTKPYPLKDLKVPGNVEFEDAQLNGRPYRRAPFPLQPGLYMPDDRTLIVATDSMLQGMLKNKQAPAKGPLSQLASKSGFAADLTILTVLEPVRPMVMAQLAQVPIPPQFAGAERLPELIDAAKVELTVVGKMRSALSLLAPSEQSAQELEALIGKFMQLGQQMILAQMAAEMGESEDPVEQASAAYAQRMTKQIFEMFKPTRTGSVLSLSQEGMVGNQTAVIGVLVALLLPAVQAAREAARRMQSSNNLKQIALAMHVYHDVHKTFPPRANVSSDGKPLLSWRVHILPFLEQEALYREFKLDEPWDSEHNRQLIERMPAVYRNPSARPSQTHASYLVPSGKGSIFEGQDGTSIGSITDGTSNTVMVLEVNEDASVIWTRPDDFAFDAAKPLVGLGSAHPGGFLAALADGSVQFLSATINPDTFLRLLMMADGNPVQGF